MVNRSINRRLTVNYMSASEKVRRLIFVRVITFRLPTSKNIREDSDHNMYVSGATEIEIVSAQEALEYFMKGRCF